MVVVEESIVALVNRSLFGVGDHSLSQLRPRSCLEGSLLVITRLVIFLGTEFFKNKIVREELLMFHS